MKREELLTDAMLFFSPNERSITAENGARYYREDVVLKAMELAGKETPLPPAEGAEDDDEIILGEPDKLNLQWSGYGVLGNCKQRQQPTSEGAEEIHNIEAMQKCLHRYVNVDEVNRYDTLVFGAMRDYADDFATLHAQKIADKMVEMMLREELIAYDIFKGYTPIRASMIVDEYLKSREK